MGEDLSISTFSPDFRGFESAVVIPRISNSGSAMVAQQTMVPASEIHGQEGLGLAQSNCIPDCRWKDSLRTILCDFHTSRVDFLKIAYGRTSSKIVVNYLTSALRPSTYRQYESVCANFKTFVRDMNPRDIDENLVFSFF